MTVCDSKDLLLEDYALLRTKNVNLENINQKLQLEIDGLKASRKEKNVMSVTQSDLEEKVKKFGED